MHMMTNSFSVYTIVAMLHQLADRVAVVEVNVYIARQVLRPVSST